MFRNRVIGMCLQAISALCFSILIYAPPAVCQIAQLPERPEQHQHHGHLMNIPMGEEKCGPTYTYAEGPQGPTHWEGVCNTGKMQAPIDIQNAEKLPLNNLQFDFGSDFLDIINDCNQYRILIRFRNNYWLKVGRKPYFLTELHFREPGENAVNSRRPRMSIQLVYLSPESVFLIIEVPVVAGKENPAMKTVLRHVPAPGKENKLHGVNIYPTDFLPMDRSFYRFPGSLTTPICNEGVTWFVMRNPIEFSEAQIAEYTKYYHNAVRPLQPLNGRPVAESQ